VLHFCMRHRRLRLLFTPILTVKEESVYRLLYSSTGRSGTPHSRMMAQSVGGSITVKCLFEVDEGRVRGLSVACCKLRLYCMVVLHGT